MTAPHNGTPTSKQAAARIEHSAPNLRGMVLSFIVSRGNYGATDEEAQIHLGMNPSTQRPRRVELDRAGMIAKTSTTRKTTSGRNAAVWVANDSCASVLVPTTATVQPGLGVQLGETK